MSWQQTRDLQSTLSRERVKSASDPRNDSTTDSSILRYIKTLTNHHVKAKQQRMDRYLQHVKHATSAQASTVQVAKPPSTTARQQQWFHDKSATMAKLGRKTQVLNDQSNPKQVAASRGHFKRSHQEQSNRQMKKLKEAPDKQQTLINGSFNRFRLQRQRKSLRPHHDDGPSDTASRVDTCTIKQQVQATQVGEESKRRSFEVWPLAFWYWSIHR